MNRNIQESGVRSQESGVRSQESGVRSQEYSVTFFLPLTAIFLIYIIIYNPPWFRKFLDELNENGDPLKEN